MKIAMFPNTEDGRREFIRWSNGVIADHKKELDRQYDELGDMLERNEDRELINWKKNQIRHFIRKIEKLEKEMSKAMAINFAEGFKNAVEGRC